jgi:hypothetical protein
MTSRMKWDDQGTLPDSSAHAPISERVQYSAANWQDSQHPRGQPENRGQFAEKAGGSGSRPGDGVGGFDDQAGRTSAPPAGPVEPPTPPGKPEKSPTSSGHHPEDIPPPPPPPPALPKKIQQLRHRTAVYANAWEATYRASRAIRAKVDETETKYNSEYAEWKKASAKHEREFDKAHAQWEKEQSAWAETEEGDEPEEPEFTDPPEEPDEPDYDKVAESESTAQDAILKRRLKQLGFDEDRLQELANQVDELVDMPDKKAASRVTAEVMKVVETNKAAEEVWLRLQAAKKAGIDPDEVMELLAE